LAIDSREGHEKAGYLYGLIVHMNMIEEETLSKIKKTFM
jgi:hypothetical protein